MKRILIVEEDFEQSSQMAEALYKAGYTCSQAFSGTEALFFVEQDPFSLVILDSALSAPGAEVICSRIRQICQLPILIFPDDLIKSDKIMGSAWNASDLSRLTVQVNHSLRNLSKSPFSLKNDAHCLQYHGLSLYPSSYLAFLDGHEIPLTRQEFKILQLLFTRPQHIFSKQELYGYAWDDFYRGNAKTINVHISNIRTKLKKYSDFQYIHTIWKKGYRRG